MTRGNYWTQGRVSRRAVVRGGGIGAVGLAGAALIGCGADDDDDGTPAPTPTATDGTPAPTPDPSAAQHGGILSQASDTDPTHFSPFHPGADPSFINTWRRDNGYYDRMWEFRETDDPDRLVMLRLAESVEQPDETTYVIHMHEAYFHDNPRSDSNSVVGARMLTAEDVVARYEYMQNPEETNATSGPLVPELQVRAIDDLTVEITTPGPRAFFWETGTSGAMVRGYELPQEMLDEDILKEHVPIGTGPFMFKDMRAGSWEESERNPNYWLADRPFLDGKRHTLQADPSAREASFRTGETHSMGFTDTRQASSVADAMGDRMQHIVYPSASGMALMGNIRRDPFKDERVREAIHRAIDIDRIINTVYFGDASHAWVFSPGRPERFPLGREAVQEYIAHDKQMAADLIAASGYDGRTLELMVPAEVPTWIDGGQLAAEDLQEVGLNLELEPRPRNIYLGMAGAKPQDPEGSSEFDLTMSVFLDYSHFTSFPPTFWNNAGLEDEEIDAIVGEIERTVDPEARQALSHQFETMMAQKATNFFPLLSVNSHQGWSSRVRGLDFELSRSGAAAWQIEMWMES